MQGPRLADLICSLSYVSPQTGCSAGQTRGLCQGTQSCQYRAKAAPKQRLPGEFSVNAGRVLSYERLMQRVWGRADCRGSRVVRTHLMRLRRKLGEAADNPIYIFAEPRVGYRMGEEEMQEPETQ